MTDHNPNVLLVDAVRRLERYGLRADISISLRSGGGLLITPGNIESDQLTAEEVVFIARDGGIKGRGQPARDWAVHQAIYVAHADVQAVVHVQSTYATALACLERPLPAFHHRVAVAGGDSVPCVPYQMPGSPGLSKAVADGLARRHACLIAHDGLVATGTSLVHAISIAIEIEFLCRSYLAALAVGEPPRLERAEIAQVLEQLRTYSRARWA